VQAKFPFFHFLKRYFKWVCVNCGQNRDYQKPKTWKIQWPLDNMSLRHRVHQLVELSRTKAFRPKSHAMPCYRRRQIFFIKRTTAIFSQLTHPAICNAFATYYEDRRKHRPGTRLQSKHCTRFDRYLTRIRLQGALLPDVRERS
jgi:hypothetical protein